MVNYDYALILKFMHPIELRQIKKAAYQLEHIRYANKRRAH